MAWLERQPLIGYTAQDDSGSSSILRFNIESGIASVSAQASATSLRGYLDSLSGCAFTRQSVIYRFVETSAPTPAAASRADRVGVFIFTTSAPGQYAIVEIPGIHDSLLLPAGAGLLVDIDSPAVVALAAALTSGIWSNHFGYDLVELDTAFLQIRH